jgi:hypothetical protein
MAGKIVPFPGMPGGSDDGGEGAVFEAPPGFEEVVRPMPTYVEACAVVAEWMNATFGVAGLGREVSGADVEAAHGGKPTVDLCVFFWTAMDWKQGSRSLLDHAGLRLRSCRPIPAETSVTRGVPLDEDRPEGPPPSAVSTAVSEAAHTWGPN